MKQPKPWFWEKRKAWYVTLNGKQIRLSENEREANAEFYRIMAAEGALTEKQTARMTVADACEAFLASKAYSRAETLKNYTKMLGPFAAAFRSRRLESVTAAECVRHVANHKGKNPKKRQDWGDSSRYMMFRQIKGLYRWARDTGLVRLNPLAGIANPWQMKARERAMTEEEYLTIMAYPKMASHFRLVLEIMWNTGARPGEVLSLSARHLDPRKPMARLQPTEHKTGGRTGKQRELFFPPDLMERLRKLALQRPQGPLIVTPKGEPVRPNNLRNAFIRARGRMGLAPDLVLYMARHAFITRLAEGGIPMSRVARLAGHSHPETAMKHYYHPEVEAMLDDVGKMKSADPEANESAKKRVAGILARHKATDPTRWNKKPSSDTPPGA